MSAIGAVSALLTERESKRERDRKTDRLTDSGPEEEREGKRERERCGSGGREGRRASWPRRVASLSLSACALCRAPSPSIGDARGIIQ